MKKTNLIKPMLIIIYTLIYFVSIFLFQTEIIDVEWGFYDGFKNDICICATILYLLCTLITLFLKIENDFVIEEENLLRSLGFTKCEEPNIYYKNNFDDSAPYFLFFQTGFDEIENKQVMNTDSQIISVLIFFEKCFFLNEVFYKIQNENMLLHFKTVEVGNKIVVEIKNNINYAKACENHDRDLIIIEICSATDKMVKLMNQKN